jgi:vesicle-associated membrane protein 7
MMNCNINNKIYLISSFYFHYLNTSNTTFMCLCEHKYPNESAFLFLEELKDLFFESFSPKEIDLAISYSLNTSFRDKLKEKLEIFNKNSPKDQISELKSVILDTSYSIIQAKDVLSQREEKIHLIVKKSEMLRLESGSFYNSSKRVKRKIFRLRRVKIIIIILLILLILGYVISTIACGGFAYPNCRGD